MTATICINMMDDTGVGESAPLYIPGSRVKELVSMEDVVKVVETGLGAFSRPDGGVVQLVRSVVPVTEHSGFFAVMPAYCREMGSLAAKLLTIYPNNVQSRSSSIIAVFEPSTGTLLALVQGAPLSAMRTAAASAVALKVLKCGNPKILCLVGTGVLARSHPEALRLICQFEEVRLWGRNVDHARQCADDIGGDCRVFENLEDACRGADVVVTVLRTTIAVVYGKWLKEGTIICGIGAVRPEWREVDDDVMHNSLVVVDSQAGVEKESGDIIQSGVKIYCEVGELVNGMVEPITKDTLKLHNKKFIFFKSLGLAVEDAVTARLVYDRHMQRTS